MPSSYSDIYQGYWVAECRYTRNNETFTGIMTLAGHSEEQVIGNMRHYFAENQAEYSFAQYDTLTPLITYVENSQQLESQRSDRDKAAQKRANTAIRLSAHILMT